MSKKTVIENPARRHTPTEKLQKEIRELKAAATIAERNYRESLHSYNVRMEEISNKLSEESRRRRGLETELEETETELQALKIGNARTQGELDGFTKTFEMLLNKIK